LLREQNFGIAEGYAWAMSIPDGTTREAMYEEKIYPVLETREEKFPEGESLDDLALRAEAAVRECILPHVANGDGAHIALASHGLCIAEAVAALVRLDPSADKTKNYRGLKNTAWAMVEVNPRSGDATAGLDVKVVRFNVAGHLDDLVRFVFFELDLLDA
jgi:broad specificity phosphatase PhoE